MRKTKIDIPPFFAELTIIIDKDLKFVENEYKLLSLDNYGAVTIKDESRHGHYIVAFESKDRSLIAHEIVHIINYIYLDVGVELDRVNDENQAYLTGWLFIQIDKFLNLKTSTK